MSVRSISSYASELSSPSVIALMREIGRTPLLTAEEIHCYSKRVQLWVKAQEYRSSFEKQYNRLPNDTELLTHLEVSEKLSFGQIAQGGKHAKQKMIQANLRLVVSIVKKFLNKGIDFLDLFQEGSIGLARAVEKYDVTTGNAFSTYAYWWICQAVFQTIAEQSRPFRLPLHAHQTLLAARKVRRTLALKLGRPPVLSEIATALEVPVASLRQYLLVGAQVYSLNMRIGVEADDELLSILDLRVETEADYAFELQGSLDECFDALTPKQRRVVSLRFGLQDGVFRTLEEVGGILGTSRECVRASLSRSFNRLRKQEKVRSLQVYL